MKRTTIEQKTELLAAGWVAVDRPRCAREYLDPRRVAAAGGILTERGCRPDKGARGLRLWAGIGLAAQYPDADPVAQVAHGGATSEVADTEDRSTRVNPDLAPPSATYATSDGVADPSNGHAAPVSAAPPAASTAARPGNGAYAIGWLAPGPELPKKPGGAS